MYTAHCDQCRKSFRQHVTVPPNWAVDSRMNFIDSEKQLSPVTAASHPTSTCTLSPRYVNSITISTSLHNFSSCSTASPIFPSHSLHVKLL